jgi:hypothetical protein
MQEQLTRLTAVPLTAAALIAMRKGQLAEAGTNASAARGQRFLLLNEAIIVLDLALPSHPRRSIRFDVMRKSPAVIVRTDGPNRAFIERIDLLQADAHERLARYELLES